MSHHSPFPDVIPFRTLAPVSSAAKAAIVGLLLLGAAAVVLLAASTEEPGRLWQALLFNWLFWSSLAIGMVMFAVALHITAADWAWSIQRFALAGVAFLPISFVLLIVVFFGSETYFHHWLHVEGDPIIDAKRFWLTLPNMIIRDFLALTILYGMAIAFAFLSLRPDVYGLAGERRRGIYDWLTRNWRGVEIEAARSQKIRNYMGPVMGLLFAFLWGMIGVDLAMTMDPHFFSTMFPVAFFWAAFHSGVVTTAIAVTLLRPGMRLTEFITPRQYHDLGKCVFAFSIFWMYLNWSQYIVIWYGLLPWEQPYFTRRFADPYGTIAAAVVFLVFVLPFLGLLTRPPKKVPAVLAFFGGLILIGYWLERFLITVPSIWEGTGLPLGLPEMGMGLGFMGLFATSYLWFVRTFPVLPSPASLAARDPSIVTVPAGAVHSH